MEEEKGTSKAAKAKAVGSVFVPHPTLAILRFWQGIVEIVLRAAVIVSAFCAFVAGSVAQGEYVTVSGVPRVRALVSRSQAAAGWLIFVTVIAMLVEGALIITRFLNFVFVATTIFKIVDICISGGFALALFVGAIPMAVYAGQWASFESGGGIVTSIRSATGGSAAFAFFTCFIFVGLGVWMVLSYFIFNWNAAFTKYASKGGSQEDAPPS